MEKTEQLILAAGCFWGVEEKLNSLPGVVDTEVGYTGGETLNPTYEQVCKGDTGHAEVVKVIFDPAALSCEEVLSAFWKLHNPTLVNEQGPDKGTQYRSAIFYSTEEQKEIALQSKKEASEDFDDPIATEILPAKEFYPAEEYHQKYFLKKNSC